jgi:hypothetical protein
MHERGSITALLIAAGLLGTLMSAQAQTPKLKIETKHGSPIEERKKQQMERLAAQYDLKKFTITRHIIIEQGVRPHSSPVLTLNGRFLGNDDLALETYIHEQGHWLLMEQRYRQHMHALYDDLRLAFSGLPTDFPRGSGDERDTYLHLAVILLEWQGMEEVVGAERARQGMELMKSDHYTAIYPAVLEHRKELESILHRYGVRW